ncbi:MAG: bifunctional fucokinase/L-fucose-1-P-guanylyltransferase [Clostridia bacterium]|nr:bifunctional fucokinase/L-fucose-1-P-guanylyltransferase [Clostridia bacterium]
MKNAINYNKIKNLFLCQAYSDAWEDYQRSLQKSSFIKWDYVILTASNESQAQAYRLQIERRLARGFLPETTKYVVLPDPDGKRVGSGGATFNVIKFIAEQCGASLFRGKRVLVIHSGGDSKRIPQYSAIGKLFSPVPRNLPDGRGSTLFDEFIIGMSGVPARFKEGMLVLSGDVQLLFNPLQIDAQFNGAAAISIKEPVETGKNHGVFLGDGKGYVKNFLHKLSAEKLLEAGAVNEYGTVDLDTGAILMDAELLEALYSLISTDGVPDETKFSEFVNENARISFYGDFMYPLASDSTLEQYYNEAPEGEFTAELRECREKIWKVLSPFSLKLICLSPAKFIHFGTTGELLCLMTENISDYEFLNWKNRAVSCVKNENEFTAFASYVEENAKIENGSYTENSYILNGSYVGKGSIVSSLELCGERVPDNVVIHGLPLNDGRFTVRIYGVKDNPKGTLEQAAQYLTTDLKKMVSELGFEEKELWNGTAHDLWNAKLYPVCNSMKDALDFSLELYSALKKKNDSFLIKWKNSDRISLCESFNKADLVKILDWQENIENRILCRNFINSLLCGTYCEDALKIFGKKGIDEDIYSILMSTAAESDFKTKIRIYYAVSRYMKENGSIFCGTRYDLAEELCFAAIRQEVFEKAEEKLPDSSCYKIARDYVDVHLPVRVNWGGGWTDTPPYCYENGGTVLNAAISINGKLPVQICVKKIKEYRIEFESQDIGVKGFAETVEEITDCRNPFDYFALHKAALIACGIIPMNGGNETLEEILERLGGGIYLSTQVIGIPKGSGLGTSSILAGACVKGIFEFLGIEKTDEDIYQIVLCMEQIMSTGGGWQDQVGGLTGGIKLISTEPGLEQQIKVTPIKVPEKAMKELSDRFALIYTGQRRLARNLLRDVVGGYIGSRPESVEALREIKPVAALMAYYLGNGDIDSFAKLLDEHWELSKKIDAGSTNGCIDQIFVTCEDLIDSKFIAGAGGGGFVMVILKKGVTKEQLRLRLSAIFQNSGVDVWQCDFVDNF